MRCLIVHFTYLLVRLTQPGHPPWVGAMSTSQRAVMLCGCGVKAGVVRVWVAGKTVIILLTRAISDRLVRGWRRVDRRKLRREIQESPMCSPPTSDTDVNQLLTTYDTVLRDIVD